MDQWASGWVSGWFKWLSSQWTSSCWSFKNTRGHSFHTHNPDFSLILKKKIHLFKFRVQYWVTYMVESTRLMKFTFKLLALAEMAAMVTYQEKINSNARSASFGLFHKKIHLFPSKCVYFGPFITTWQWTYISTFYSSVGFGGVEFQRVPSYNLQLPTADIGLRVTIVSFTNPLAFKWGGEPV